MKKHKHAEVIKAWADGAEIEYEDCGWHDCTTSVIWDEETKYRVKPAAPKWLQTTMTDTQLAGGGSHIYGEGARLRAIANAAIAHECSTGALVPADKAREIEAKARAEGVKEGGKRNDDRDLLVKIQALKEVGTEAYGHIDRLMNGDAK